MSMNIFKKVKERIKSIFLWVVGNIVANFIVSGSLTFFGIDLFNKNYRLSNMNSFWWFVVWIVVTILGIVVINLLRMFTRKCNTSKHHIKDTNINQTNNHQSIFSSFSDKDIELLLDGRFFK